MSSMDIPYHDEQDKIYLLHNPEPTSPLVRVGNGNKEALKTLANIFRKSNPPAVPPRVPVMEVDQNKLQEMNHEGTQMKRPP